MRTLIQSKPLGFCCPAAFFAANRKVATAVLAERLGIHVRTVREWRSRWGNGELLCEHNPLCLIGGAPKKMQRMLEKRVNLGEER